jgi:hypothetical protein
MRNDELCGIETVGIVVVTLICCCLVSCPGFLLGSMYGYKKGQIDAINKKIEFELVTYEDGTAAYERIVEEQ